MDEAMLRQARNAEAQAQWTQVMRANLAATIMPIMVTWYLDQGPATEFPDAKVEHDLADVAVGLADAVIARLNRPRQPTVAKVNGREAAAE